jgi:hypothetical protein
MATGLVGTTYTEEFAGTEINSAVWLEAFAGTGHITATEGSGVLRLECTGAGANEYQLRFIKYIDGDGYIATEVTYSFAGASGDTFGGVKRPLMALLGCSG